MTADRTAEDAASKAGEPPKGLHYQGDYLTKAQCLRLIQAVDAAPWNRTLRRRVQHYGWRYDYRARRVRADDWLGPPPPWLVDLALRLRTDGWFATMPTQAIVNEYEPGQGIAPHVDCLPCFGDVVASISLISPCVMRFARVEGVTSYELDLAPGSLLVLSDDARSQWTHAIVARRSDIAGGRRRPRARRISVTFRTVRSTVP